MESHHPGRPCGPCYLCGKKQKRYCHLNALEEQHQEFIQRYLTVDDVPGDSCICRAHQMEAMRHLNDACYVPKWKKSDNGHILKCTYPECQASSDRDRVVVPLESTKTLFSKVPNTDLSHVQALCDKHYQTLYRQAHAPSPCAGCGARPKAHNHYNRKTEKRICLSRRVMSMKMIC